MTDLEDLTLEEVKEAIAPFLPNEAAFDGWTPLAMAASARAAGIAEDRAALAFGAGPLPLIDAWFASIDAAIVVGATDHRLSELRIRERIGTLVMMRIETLRGHREALRRAMAILAMPPNAPTALRLGWRAADVMWRLAGDTAIGPAFYTKRATLALVYGSTLLAFLQDEGEDLADTRAFLARRIDEVMRFEKVKARFRADPERQFGLTRFLGRLRYPAGQL